MGDLVHMRDFKRKEEQMAEIKRFADRLCDLGDQIRLSQMPPVQPSYSAPERDPA